MARLLDQILVIDVESTCWQGPSPHGQMSEIIEIGVCPLEVATLRRLEKRSILVRPMRSEISAFCTQLTGLKPEMFHTAGSLYDALQILRHDYLAPERLWASWGDYDRHQFQRVCEAFGLDYPFSRTHLNVKTLFSVALGHERELGLDRAYAALGRAMDGVHHRGDDDAWNTAGLLEVLLRKMRI